MRGRAISRGSGPVSPVRERARTVTIKEIGKVRVREFIHPFLCAASSALHPLRCMSMFALSMILFLSATARKTPAEPAPVVGLVRDSIRGPRRGSEAGGLAYTPDRLEAQRPRFWSQRRWRDQRHGRISAGDGPLLGARRGRGYRFP